MDITSIVFFILGATIGVVMLTYLLKGHNIPKALTIAHGLFVVSGLILLIMFNLMYKSEANWTSVVLFLMAATGGLYILHRDIVHKKVPVPIVFIHAIIAASGLIIMVINLSQQNHS